MPAIVPFPPIRSNVTLTVTSPLTISEANNLITIGLNQTSLPGGTVQVFKLRRALGQLGQFDAVQAGNGFAVDPGNSLVYEAWTSGGAYTQYGDTLSDAIEAIIGPVLTQAAYNAALLISL